MTTDGKKFWKCNASFLHFEIFCGCLLNDIIMAKIFRVITAIDTQRTIHEKPMISVANGGTFILNASVITLLVRRVSSLSKAAAGSSSVLHASRFGLDPSKNRFHAPIVYHERYSFPDWPPAHSFPMDKFERLAHAVMTTSAKTLPGISTLSRPLVQKPSDLFRPYDFCDIPRAWLAEPTGPIRGGFLDRFLNARLTHEEKRRIGFREQTDRPELIERTVLEVGGTILTAQLALRYGLASNLAGGTHHAHSAMGAGYTILNDLAVASKFVTAAGGGEFGKPVDRVLVVDCDVHQGDGTAKFGGDGDGLSGKLFTLSIHCASNYPQLKANSTYDIGLEDGIRDDEYMEILEESVTAALNEVNPDLVLYDAGVDIYQEDKLGRLNISEAGIRRRDRWVLDTCASRNIPVAAVIGGGYDKDVDALARRHAIVHEECAYVWRKHNMWKRVVVESGMEAAT